MRTQEKEQLQIRIGDLRSREQVLLHWMMDNLNNPQYEIVSRDRRAILFEINTIEKRIENDANRLPQHGYSDTPNHNFHSNYSLNNKATR
jgi:hypothetical protein